MNDVENLHCLSVSLYSKTQALAHHILSSTCYRKQIAAIWNKNSSVFEKKEEETTAKNKYFFHVPI
jgi:hypothetical protein